MFSVRFLEQKQQIKQWAPPSVSRLTLLLSPCFPPLLPPLTFLHHMTHACRLLHVYSAEKEAVWPVGQLTVSAEDVNEQIECSASEMSVWSSFSLKKRTNRSDRWRYSSSSMNTDQWAWNWGFMAHVQSSLKIDSHWCMFLFLTWPN